MHSEAFRFDANNIVVLMFVLWYCHKRGREVRLEKEDKEKPIADSDLVEELPDDPTLPAPATGPLSPSIHVESPSPAAAPGPDLPPPPIGANAPGRNSPVAG